MQKNSYLSTKLLVHQGQLQQTLQKVMDVTHTQIQEIFFFIIARGSTTETMEHLTTAYDEKYITKEMLNTLEEKCETVIKLINGYINYLDKSKAIKNNAIK